VKNNPDKFKILNQLLDEPDEKLIKKMHQYYYMVYEDNQLRSQKHYGVEDWHIRFMPKLTYQLPPVISLADKKRELEIKYFYTLDLPVCFNCQ
jgi:hypothetical protein